MQQQPSWKYLALQLRVDAVKMAAGTFQFTALYRILRCFTALFTQFIYISRGKGWVKAFRISQQSQGKHESFIVYQTEIAAARTSSEVLSSAEKWVLLSRKTRTFVEGYLYLLTEK